VRDALVDRGTALEPATRVELGRRLGFDFSHVRVHASRAAERTAQLLDARAYTVGRQIVFGAGQFAPHPARRLLLARTGTRARRPERSEPGYVPGTGVPVTTPGHPDDGEPIARAYSFGPTGAGMVKYRVGAPLVGEFFVGDRSAANEQHAERLADNARHHLVPLDSRAPIDRDMRSDEEVEAFVAARRR
jgi:Domain of unknown function (DUF4157)